MTPKSRWGLFGGSFDPIHAGHLHAARAAQGAFGLERVLFVPARQSPHKLAQQPAPAAARLELLELATAGMEDFVVDRRELDRAGPSFTLDTVRELIAEQPAVEFALIFGTDNLVGLPDWRGVHDLLALVTPIVVHREGDAERLLADLDGRLSSVERAALRDGLLRLPPVECSSTELRAKLALGVDVGALLPGGVEARIRELGLYREVR